VIEQLTALPRTYTRQSLTAAADFNTRIRVEGGANVLAAAQDMEGIALRYGFFYGPGTWFHPDGDVATQVRQQQFPIVGNGVWSWLHIEDAASATVAAAERGSPGIYLIVNDQPLAVREWLPAFCSMARELTFQPRPLEWVVDTAPARAS
jgi:2-alkyl-3-oxoalkanoate reductase